MNICIIGLGWLGAPLAKHLQNEGHFVIGTNRSTAKQAILEKEGIQSVIFDIESDDNIPRELINKIDVVILTIPPIKREEFEYYGDRLNRIATAFPDNTRFIFTSSTSVYSKSTGIYNELSKDLNKSSVILNTELVLKSTLKSRLTILRLGGLIGLSRHPVNSLQGRDNIKNPKGLINFVHLNDVILSIQSILDNSCFGEIFNVVNPSHPTRQEYYQSLVDKWDLPNITFNKSDTSIQRTIDASKICSDLEFNFSTSIYTFNK